MSAEEAAAVAFLRLRLDELADQAAARAALPAPSHVSELRSRIAVTAKPSNLWFGAQIAPYFAASAVKEPNFQFGGHRQVQLDGLRAAGSSNIGALKIPRSQWVQAVADCATFVD